MQRANMESFFRSIDDLRRTDLRSDLPQLKTPILGIYGAKDNIVSPKNAQVLDSIVDTSQVAIMNRSRHFPMTDEPDEFLRVLMNFLEDRPLDSPLAPLPSKNGNIKRTNGYRPIE